MKEKVDKQEERTTNSDALFTIGDKDKKTKELVKTEE